MTYTELDPVVNAGIDGFLKYPLTGDYYFYGKILLGLWVIITLTLYFEEKSRIGRSNFLSCLAVGGIGIIILAVIGSLFGIITNDILILTFVICGIFLVLWLLTSDV